MKNLTLIFALISCCISTAQSYIGYDTDNFNGIHGVTVNPANIADSRVRFDLNLFSSSALIANDYVGLSLDNATQLFDGLDFTDLATTASSQNQVLANVEFLGPSLMFSLSEKHGIGLITKVRLVNNYNNINGTFLESIVDGFPTEDFSFDQNNLDATTHIWGEVGLSYGRVLYYDYDKHYLKGGVTLKYLMGGGVAQGFSNSLSGSYTSNNDQIALNGDLSYVATYDEDQEPTDFLNNISPGFGADIGFIYEYRTESSRRTDADDNPRGITKYRAKIGVSVLDIGSLTYKNSDVTQYLVNGTVSADEIESDFEDALDNNFTETTTTDDIKISLPTSLNLTIDYKISSRLYANLNVNQTLVKQEDSYNNNRLNLITLTPRFESRFFSAYLPISHSPLGATVVGAGIKFGPIIIGSGSILSNLLADNPQMANVYVASKIRLTHKK